MAPRKASRHSETAQSHIPFGVAKRKSQHDEDARLNRLAKEKASVLNIDQPRLRERKAAAERRNSEKPETASQLSIDEILNGAESEKLLKQMRDDRFQFPRFHQEDMQLCDIIFHLFDVSQEYGPSQGLTRLQRWKRADMLGKQPPQHLKTMLEAAEKRPDFKAKYEMSLFGALG